MWTVEGQEGMETVPAGRQRSMSRESSQLWDSRGMCWSRNLGSVPYSSGRQAGRGKCESRWKCNFLMTAADGKKTQECIHTMPEPFESAWPSRNVRTGAVAMAPLPNPGVGKLQAGTRRPTGEGRGAARRCGATGRRRGGQGAIPVAVLGASGPQRHSGWLWIHIGTAPPSSWCPRLPL